MFVALPRAAPEGSGACKKAAPRGCTRAGSGLRKSDEKPSARREQRADQSLYY